MVIQTTSYPESLKVSKVVPIPKADKDKTSVEGWHLINVVVALSEIVEQVFVAQILCHMDENKIDHSLSPQFSEKQVQTVTHRQNP